MRFSELDGRSIGLWGAGLETTSFAHIAAVALPRTRIAVIVLEDDTDSTAFAPDATVVDASLAVDALSRCDVLVRSPGVSIYRPELTELAQRGLPITTPTGLWLAERRGRGVLGVTGTKGKSTIASLVAHLVRAAGHPVELAGNIGRPALELLDVPEDEVVVVELSSYQIADLSDGPEVAMVANLYREHLNWHLSDDRYRQDKLRLLTLPGVQSCVLNVTSPEVIAAPRACRDSWTYGAAPGWHVTENGIARADAHIASADLPLLGPHNALNVCGALTALDALGIAYPPLPEALETFSGLPHRLQLVHEADGVVWVDDSISTTPESAAAAIASFPDRAIVLIGGGQDRGQDYRQLGAVLAERRAHVLGLPDTGARLVDAAQAAGVPADHAFVVEDLASAVAAAAATAVPGTVVLLSPAAPSYNAYANFEERGDHFRRLAARA